jgi:hypothetical protein
MVVALPIGCGGRVSETTSAPTALHPDASSAHDTSTLEPDTGSFVEPAPDTDVADTGSPFVDTGSPFVDTGVVVDWDTSIVASDGGGWEACVGTDGSVDGEVGAYCGGAVTYTESIPCGVPADSFWPVSPADPSDLGVLCAGVCARGFGPADAGLSGCPSYGYPSRSCTVSASRGTVTCAQTCSCPAGGRKPEGFVERSHAGAPLAAFHAQMADLEAVSVDAFRILRGELARLGAPKSLRRRCSKAARDEVRHARAMRRLAHELGAARRDPPVVTRGPTRSVEELARENLTAGCVRETWGAALAVLQSRTARDLSIRSAMQKIAADETRHAELSWSIAQYLDRKLDRAARERLRARRAEAVRELRCEVARGFDASLVEHAGLPAREEALALFDALADRLWTSAS